MGPVVDTWMQLSTETLQREAKVPVRIVPDRPGLYAAFAREIADEIKAHSTAGESDSPHLARGADRPVLIACRYLQPRANLMAQRLDVQYGRVLRLGRALDSARPSAKLRGVHAREILCAARPRLAHTG